MAKCFIFVNFYGEENKVKRLLHHGNGGKAIFSPLF